MRKGFLFDMDVYFKPSLTTIFGLKRPGFSGSIRKFLQGFQILYKARVLKSSKFVLKHPFLNLKTTYNFKQQLNWKYN